MAEYDLRLRTKQFALRIIRMFNELPDSETARVLGKQALRSGTSVGANYREACRARSDAEFISKVETSLQELEETCYWLELLSEASLFSHERLAPLLNEASELLAILTASVNTVKRRLRTRVRPS